MSPAAIELIDRLREKRTGRWLFPGDKPGAHMVALWYVWLDQCPAIANDFPWFEIIEPRFDRAPTLSLAKILDKSPKI